MFGGTLQFDRKVARNELSNAEESEESGAESEYEYALSANGKVNIVASFCLKQFSNFCLRGAYPC